MVLETEGLVEDAVSRGMSDRVSRDVSVAVNGESVPVRSKRDQLDTVWSGLYAVSECVEADSQVYEEKCIGKRMSVGVGPLFIAITDQLETPIIN